MNKIKSIIKSKLFYFSVHAIFITIAYGFFVHTIQEGATNLKTVALKVENQAALKEDIKWLEDEEKALFYSLEDFYMHSHIFTKTMKIMAYEAVKNNPDSKENIEKLVKLFDDFQITQDKASSNIYFLLMLLFIPGFVILLVQFLYLFKKNKKEQ